MKVAVGVICICMSMLFFCIGCSDEEQIQTPEEKVVVKKNIPEKPKLPPGAVVVKPRPKKLETKPQKITAAAKSAPNPETKVVLKKKPEVKKEKGYYFTKKGENLSSIALKLDDYKDSKKWPLIYRLNVDKLTQIKVDKDFPNRAIPQGTKLKIITPEEADINLKKRADIKYVINVLSSQSNERVVLNAVKLIKAGYPAYITEVNVKGKDWMRIRIGFYSMKKDADLDSRKITELLNIPDIWVTNIGKEEFKSFGKY